MFLNFKHKIFGINNDHAFEKIALEIFHYQADFNKIYKTYINHLGILPEQVKTLLQIPFLPIDFFKTQDVITEKKEPERIFTSSGTTGASTSRHLITNVSVYEESFFKTFELFYGDIRNFCILALLPSYIERQDSSLLPFIPPVSITMVFLNFILCFSAKSRRAKLTPKKRIFCPFSKRRFNLQTSSSKL